MPYPAQVDPDLIVPTALRLLVSEGTRRLSLGRLAKELGVKTPSLYRYIRDKDGLVRAINTRTTDLLFQAIGAALANAPSEPYARLAAVAQAYRRFAHANARTYVLAMGESEPARQPDPEYLVKLALPLQAIMTPVSGEALSLPALRSLLALVHGFVMLELASQLRRGGDLDDAFTCSVEALLRGWSQELYRA